MKFNRGEVILMNFNEFSLNQIMPIDTMHSNPEAGYAGLTYLKTA
jgi:hypothetical protein